MAHESPLTAASDTSDLLAEAQAEAAALLGNIAEFWGFTRTQGRVFGLLFMSPEPRSQASVRRQLGISAGSASMTLASLVDWGVVHREGRLYAAETDFWKAVTGVMRRREREYATDAIGRLAAIAERLHSAPTDDPRVPFARQRIEHLHALFELGRSFLDAFVANSPLRALLARITRRSRKLPPPVQERDNDVRFGA